MTELFRKLCSVSLVVSGYEFLYTYILQLETIFGMVKEQLSQGSMVGKSTHPFTPAELNKGQI